MTLNQGEAARTPLDLNALEKWIEHELESYSTRTNTFRLDEMRRVIAELRIAREALQQITWHIGCSEVKRGGLLVSGPHGALDLGQFCPGCIARHALDRLTTSEDKG